MTQAIFLVGIAGGSASGKTRLARALARRLSPAGAYVIKEDDYYVDAGGLPGFDPAQFNFDEPAAKDHALLLDHLRALKAGRKVRAPRYDFTTHRRRPGTTTRAPAPVILVEGLHVLAAREIAELFDLSVYVEACRETRFRRRLARDIAERGRTPHFVRDQFETLVEPMHCAHVEPQRDRADLVVENMGAPDFAALAEPILARMPVLARSAQPE